MVGIVYVSSSTHASGADDANEIRWVVYILSIGCSTSATHYTTVNYDGQSSFDGVPDQ